MDRVRLGIVGLGAIAQAVHLPNLTRLWDRFEIVHVSDIAGQLAEDIAATQGPRVKASTDSRAVHDDSEVDAVLILASGPHAPAARAALEAGKHVFVEKPLALTVAEARDLDTLAHSVGRVLQVGYMKLHDPIVLVAVQAAQAIRDPRLLRITVLHPTEEVQQRHLSIRRASVPAAALESARTYEADMTERAIGVLPPIFGWTYREVALGSIIHQVALARHLVGSLPDKVEFADAWPLEIADGRDPAQRGWEPPTILALSEVDANLRFELDWVWAPAYPEYVERLEIFGLDMRLELEMPTPYALDQRGRLRVDRSVDGRRSGALTTGDHRSGFQAELEDFHAAVTAGPPFPSDAAGAANDTAFLQALVAALARGRGESPGGESARS